MSQLTPTAIHHVTTYGPRGVCQRRSMAACARRGTSVDLSACAACEHGRGFALGVDSPDARSVLCDAPRPGFDTRSSSGQWDRIDARPGTVGGWMRREVACVRPDVDLTAVALLMMERDIGGLPVVDEDERPIGMISKSDVVPLFTRAARRRDALAALDSFDADARDDHDDDVRVAGDIMSPVLLTLRETDPLGTAAEALVGRRVHRAPVIGADGRIVGVLTSFDLVRALAASA